jgi:hypothetical protein
MSTIISEVKNYNMFNVKGKPKTKHELNNKAKFINLKDMDENSRNSLDEKEVYLWDMF